MWREFIESFKPDSEFSEPASAAEIAQVEQGLRVSLPDDLRGLLQETNGVAFSPAVPGMEEASYCCLVWSTDEMLEENLTFRQFDEDYPEEFEQLSELLFFASELNGDPVAFRVSDGRVSNPAVVAMSHENYGERWEMSASLRDYLSIVLGDAAESGQGAVKHNAHGGEGNGLWGNGFP